MGLIRIYRTTEKLPRLLEYRINGSFGERAAPYTRD
jgi:hypothetical protein